MIIIYRVKLAFSSFVLFFVMADCLAQSAKLQDEKELDLVNFESIRKVLNDDGLAQTVKEKKKQVEVIKTVQLNIEKDTFNYPKEDELWGLASEYWLVKNAQVLGWDFEKPDYGLESSFKSALEKMGFYQKKFKILLLNTPSLVRASLPGSEGETILLLSVPFIRSMDLSKLEISILLLEDYLRMQSGYFKKAVATEKMSELAGTNFYGKKPDMSLLEEIVKKYGHQINQKGYSFQQQFEVTKKMDAILKAHPELWNVYFKLLSKIQIFVKANVQYKDYVKLYPSPEMQLKWLSPEEKNL